MPQKNRDSAVKIFHYIQDMQSQAKTWHRAGLRIGLVPTMGNLHAGHLSLIRKAMANSDRVVVSIFVNPTQFGPTEDYAQYPRTFEQDRKQCEELGVQAIFCPNANEMYLPGASTWITETRLSQALCGRSRPTHFRGVTTVVGKLFNAVLPDVAVFGQKDAQQALVIQQMVRDLNIPVKLMISPIIREADGLAMSSRNQYLTPDQRQRARTIHQALAEIQENDQHKKKSAPNLVRLVAARIRESGGRIDYVTCVDAQTLTPIIGPITRRALLAVAVFYGSTRLLDNCFLTPTTKD